jgi:hypothetical protein
MNTPGTAKNFVQQLRAFETLYFILNRQPVSHPLLFQISVFLSLLKKLTAS